MLDALDVSWTLIFHSWAPSGRIWRASGLVFDAQALPGMPLGCDFELICHGFHMFVTYIYGT